MLSSFESPKTFESVEEYLKARDSLITAERNMGYESRTKRSPLEVEAEEILQGLKAWEEHNHHGVQADGSGVDAGHRYFHGMNAVSKSKLLHIAQMAPKGCMLHSHFDAMLPPETILEDARKQDRLYIKTDAPLTSPGFFNYALPAFNVFADELVLTESTNLFSRAYITGSWMKYSEFLRLFPGGADRAEDWIKRRMVLQAEDSYHPRQTVNGIWKQFNRSVMVIRSMLGYETAYREHFRRILWKFAEDGISHGEIRFGLDYGYFIKSDDGSREIGVPEIVKMLSMTLQEEVPRIQASGLSFWGARIIYACMRNSSKEAMAWNMNTAIEMKQAYPQVICGFDMHGQEDTGHPHKAWIPELIAMRAKITSLGIDLPFIFHAGETHDHGGDTDSNLYDVILLGTKRIGHGFSITKHPLLMQLCKERNIAIETCPISNEVLGLCPTTKSHHLPTLMSNCVPCTVSSDDAGSWGASVLSHDFYQAMMGSNNMSLLGWRVLVDYSIEHACLSPEARREITVDLEERWIKFCQWIVDTYGTKKM